MELFNKTFARLGDWYHTLTPGARIAAGLLLVVCAASVAFLCNQQITDSETYLFGGEPVPASQWPIVVQAFATAGLTDYEMEGNRIRVPHGKQAAYMGALANAGALPNNFGDSLRKMLDRSSSPWIGKWQQEEMSKVALQDELTKIINSMPGIESASVLYNVQTEQGLNPKKQITASVNVKPVGNQLLTGRQVDMIRQVVGPPIGVDPQGVTIIDFNGATYPAAAPSTGGDSAADRYTKTKLEYEQKYAEKIREALGFVTGAMVTVNVELHAEPDAMEKSVQSENRAAIKGAIANSSETETAGGVNQPAIIRSLVETVVGTPKTKQQSFTDQERSRATDSRQVAKMGLTPKCVTVSISIPSSYYEDVWRQRHPESSGIATSRPDGETLRAIEAEVCANIKQHVLPIVPWPENAGQDRAQLVTVTTFQRGGAAVESLRPETSDYTLSWWSEHGTTVSVGMLAVVSLFMLRWIVRSASTAKVGATPLRLADETLEESDDDELTHRETAGRSRGPHGPSLREELASIVQDDPDVAASVLRNWIGSAG